MTPTLAETNSKFLAQTVIDMYDEEVARHPGGIHVDAVREIIAPKVGQVIAAIRSSELPQEETEKLQAVAHDLFRAEAAARPDADRDEVWRAIAPLLDMELDALLGLNLTD